MTGFLGTAVDAAIGWLVQSILGSFFTGQMEVWTREIGLAEDLEKLKFEMRNVEMVLAAAAGSMIGDNKPLAKSLDDLRDLLHDSEDVMDELDYYRLQQQIIEGKGCAAPSDANSEGSYVSSSTPPYVFELVCSATSQMASWASLGRKRKHEEEGPAHSTMLTYEIKHDISQRINGIVRNLCTIGNSVQRVLQLEISRPMATSSENQNIARNARLTTSIPTECKVYGRDAERDKIIELLINGESSDLNVLPVVGIGGVGKTTLARFVYRDQRIEDHFDLQMWVCVSTNFNEVRLTLEILEHVCKDRKEYENISNFNVLQGILLDNIRNKRFLLVLDDMWEDKNRGGWTNFLAPLKSNQVKGCMVLATTRTKSVAKMIGTIDEVRLSGLDEKEFWLFFKACAFGNENYEGDPSLQSIGKQIGKALKGCPLAAKSVGALLNTSICYKHWRTVHDKWKSLQEDADDILPILKLSYDYLPIHLQHCFSYCSLFPEDHRFNGKKLVHAWISQNFVQCEDSTMRLEETGQQYLDRLVDLCFFQKVGSHYVMHDLMHVLAGKVSSSECATIDGLKPEAIRPSVRHLSIITTAFDKDEYSSFNSDKFDRILQKVRPLKKLRTLMLFGKNSKKLSGSLRTLCKEAKYLRLLRISVTDADMSSINSWLNPCHLRYLEFFHFSTTYMSVNGVHNNTEFSQALTSFYHIQVLDVGTSGKFVVHTDMNNLVNLRHLIAHEDVQCAIACVGNMTSLQELKFKVQNVGSFEIRQLQYMNELALLGISQLENVKTKEEAREARLIGKEYLDNLSLSWENCSMGLEPETAKDVLEGLQPHQNLKTLEINGYSGATSPTWLSSTFSITSLQTIHLEKCAEWQILPSLEMFPCLRKLTLIKMLNLMEISVPSLEELILIDMPKLEKCIGSYGMELTSHLRVLMIKSCPQLNEFTFFQSHSSFHAEQKSWFPCLNKLSIVHCPHIIKWGILPLREMGALKELELMELTAVRELSVPSLEKLVLTKMSSLEICSSRTTSPPLQLLPSQGDHKDWTSNLRRFTVHDCPCLIVSYPLPPSALISELSIKGVPTLPTMTMTRRDLTVISSKLSVLDDSILAFHNLSGIASLAIENCPNLVSLSSESFSQLISLEHLRIYKCPNLTKSSITSEVVEENNTSASSLVLPSLKSLYISKCGITGTWLTQMLPHSQSIEQLDLTDCPEIKFLSISKPTETEGTSSWASAVLTSPQEEHLKMPYNILCSLKKCRLSSSSLKSVQLHSFMALEELWISGCGHLRVLEGLQFLTSLRSLDIKMNRKLSYEWDLKLQEREQGCNRIQLFPPSLEELRIGKLTDGVQCRLLACLPTITKLAIERSPELTSLQLGYCAALKTLEVKDCKSLASIERFQLIRNLTSLAVFNSPGLASWLELVSHEQEASQIWSGLETLSSDGSVLSRPFCRQLTSLRRLHFSSWASKHRRSLVSLTEEQERALQLLTSLQELQFSWCTNLLSLPANLHSLTSLETLCIMCCKSITRLPDMGLPPSLTRLLLFSCSEELHMQCRIAATEKLTVMIDGQFVN